MISLQELHFILHDIESILGSLNIPHHFTGGIAASFYGEPRFTQDIDVVVALETDSTKLKELYQALQSSYDINEDAMHEAVKRRSIFQALHQELLIKVDFHVGELVPQAFRRSRLVEIAPDLAINLISREDAILAKLVWISRGSERSKRDVIMMLRSQMPLDQEYLSKCAKELKVENILLELHAAAKKD